MILTPMEQVDSVFYSDLIRLNAELTPASIAFIFIRGNEPTSRAFRETLLTLRDRASADLTRPFSRSSSISALSSVTRRSSTVGRAC